jgi:predicted permease
MMATEVALALMLMVGAGLLASSLVRLYRSAAGFDPNGIQNIAFSMDQQPLKGDALMQFYHQLGGGLRQQPGVTNVSFAGIIPFTDYVWDENFSAPAGKEYDIHQNGVSPGYFETMRIPLFRGRDFRWTDATATGLKIILNQSAVKLLFAGRDPVGHIVIKYAGDPPTRTQYEVIGVVGDAKYEDLRSAPPPTAYLPMTQGRRPACPFVSRSGTHRWICSFVGRRGANADKPDGPRYSHPGHDVDVQYRRRSLSAERMMALLSIFFAACALVVTAVGLYGTLAYTTARRTSEIGIRMALGAQRTQVAGLIFRQNTAVAVGGTAAGLIAALLASRALASFLYGTSVRDPWIFAGSIALLAVIASAASLLPALRAARIEPIAAIRCE